MKLGVLGIGNMGSAIISALIDKGISSRGELYIFDIDKTKTSAIASAHTGVNVSGIEEIIRINDLLLIAVKPQDIEKLLSANRDGLDKSGKTLISIAAGVRIKTFRKYLEKPVIARVMPNMPLQIGMGAAGIYFDTAPAALPQIKECIMNIFSSCGVAKEVSSEGLLDAVTGLSGSGPAYVFSFINALAEAGVMEGLPLQTSMQLALETVIGSASYASIEMKKGTHIEELKDRIMSPGGTTARGIFALEDGGFRATVMKAVREAASRSRELGEK